MEIKVMINLYWYYGCEVIIRRYDKWAAVPWSMAMKDGLYGENGTLK